MQHHGEWVHARRPVHHPTSFTAGVASALAPTALAATHAATLAAAALAAAALAATLAATLAAATLAAALAAAALATAAVAVALASTLLTATITVTAATFAATRPAYAFEAAALSTRASRQSARDVTVASIAPSLDLYWRRWASLRGQGRSRARVQHDFLFLRLSQRRIPASAAGLRRGGHHCHGDGRRGVAGVRPLWYCKALHECERWPQKSDIPSWP